jgi:hypothetical protein
MPLFVPDGNAYLGLPVRAVDQTTARLFSPHPDQAAQAMRHEEMQAEIEDFIEGLNQPTYRGMRIRRRKEP